MVDSLKTGFIQALSLGMVGLITGAVGGWIGLAAADRAEGVAGVTANIYLVFIILLPALLTLLTWANMDQEDGPKYATQAQSFALLFVAGLGGVIVASGLFLVAAINVPVVFSREDPNLIRPALLAGIGWGSFITVAVVTSVSALLLAGWAYQQQKKS